MRKLLIPSLTFLLIACYQSPKVEGFSEEIWNSSIEDCNDQRLEIARSLIDQFEVIKGSNQNEIQNLLGKQDGHELFNRNQKFFYYNLTCSDSDGQNMQLRLRFDAIGSLREGTLVKRKILLKP